MRVFNLESYLDIFFPWLDPCTSSLAKWMNYLSSHQTGYWNPNCRNHCPHWLWCYREFHWHWPSIQGELSPVVSSQTHLCVQCRWNGQHQRNHQMEGPDRHPFLSVQRNHWTHGPQSQQTTSNLGNALVAQMEPQNWLDIEHCIHSKVPSLPTSWLHLPMIPPMMVRPGCWPKDL